MIEIQEYIDRGWELHEVNLIKNFTVYLHKNIIKILSEYNFPKEEKKFNNMKLVYLYKKDPTQHLYIFRNKRGSLYYVLHDTMRRINVITMNFAHIEEASSNRLVKYELPPIK